MRKQKTITIQDKEITVNEITALESQEYIEGLANDESSFIDELFPDRVPVSLVRLCTGLTEEKLLSFYPSEIEEIIDAVEEVNPTSASRIKKLAEIGRKALEEHPELLERLQEKDSKKTAAD
jgi:flagellar biosynthesis component FlhA